VTEKKAERAQELRERFLKITGYSERDIIGENPSTRVFVTSNGGKYVLSPKGTAVRTIQGPDAPQSTEG
jgi:hypothetical protein